MKTYRLHFIRHGLTQDNIDGLYSGHTDTPLCAEGREQIIAMKDEYVYPKGTFLFSSPLKRCLETAQIIYPDLKSLIIDDLIEYNFGEFDGRSAEDLHKRQALFDDWLTGKPDVKPPFGESNEEFAARVCNCLIKLIDGLLKSETDDAVIVTHGGVISVLMENFGLPEAKMHEWLTPSGCGYTVRITPSLWTSGHKFEVIEEIPLMSEKEGNYYDGWDYYPEEKDFDISEYLKDFND